MAEENEFAVDSVEAHQAAAMEAEQNPEVVPGAPSEVPNTPADDIDTEAAAGEAVPDVVPGPIPGAPVVEVAAPAAPAPVVVAPAPVPTEDDRRVPIQGLKEEADTSLEGVALETKLILAKQPKVRMMIPLDPGEKAGAYRTVLINGYRFDVRKNTMVDLPEAVAALLSDAYQITSEVLENDPRNLNQANEATKRALGAA